MANNVTKRDVLNALNTVNFDGSIMVGDVEVTSEDIKNYIETSLAQLDTRAAKAAERAAKNKAAGDELRARIKATLDSTPKTIAEIVELLDDPEVTTAKVVARVSQLVKAEEAVKGEKREDGRKLMTYAIAE